MAKKLARWAVIPLLTVFVFVSAAAQNEGSAGSVASTARTVPATRADYLRLESEVRDTQKNFEQYKELLQLFCTLFVIIGVLPAVVGMYENARSRRESKPVMELLLQGERDRQTYARETHDSLKSSSDTISLVNDTLTLAKEASERAAKSIERRALAELETLDQDAQLLLTNAGSSDDRALVSEPRFRTDLETLAERIGAIEVYRIVLDQTIDLTARCHFIRGMHEHLKQHFEVAIKNWQLAANHEKADDDLRSLAWYWQGYENNNLKNFEAAKLAFVQAERYSDPPRKFELQRIAVESEFFATDASRIPALITEMRSILREAERLEAPQKTRDSIKQTLGNFLYVMGKALQSSDRNKAIELFKEAREVFASSSERNKWSLLGYSQCCILLGEDLTEATRILKTEVMPQAQQEFVRRVEPRTKALARFTELICCMANEDLRKDVGGIHSQLLSAVGEVDNRLTLYSLLQRRNVSKDQFQNDVTTMKNEGIGA